MQARGGRDNRGARVRAGAGWEGWEHRKGGVEKMHRKQEKAPGRREAERRPRRMQRGVGTGNQSEERHGEGE